MKTLTTEVLGAFAKDPRVRIDGEFVVVQTPGQKYYVAETLGWGIFVPPHLDIASDTEGNLAIQIRSCEDAIRVLLGEPRTS